MAPQAASLLLKPRRGSSEAAERRSPSPLCSCPGKGGNLGKFELFGYNSSPAYRTGSRGVWRVPGAPVPPVWVPQHRGYLESPPGLVTPSAGSPGHGGSWGPAGLCHLHRVSVLFHFSAGTELPGRRHWERAANGCDMCLVPTRPLQPRGFLTPWCFPGL